MRFHLGDILSITTGVLMSPNTMVGVERLLGFMSGETNLSSIALVMLAKKAALALLAQHPQLADVVFPYDECHEHARGPDREKFVVDWLDAHVATFGETFEVEAFDGVKVQDGA